MKEIGREREGLYFLIYQRLPGYKRTGYSLPDRSYIVLSLTNSDIELWHMRLGHVPSKILLHLFPRHKMKIVDTMNKCTVCPCSRQTRLSFLV